MKKTTFILWSMLILSSCLWPMQSAQAFFFKGLGDLPGGDFLSVANDVSADGSVVVGCSHSASGTEAFRWTEVQGMVGLSYPPGGGSSSQAYGVSADGSVVVGTSSSASGWEAFHWTQEQGTLGLGDLPGGIFTSWGYDVSADGSVVVGASESASGLEAFRWTEAQGMVGLGDLPGGQFFGWAYGVSADGSVIVGESYADYGSYWGMEAFRWTEAQGMVGLGWLPDESYESRAHSVSADGSVIVGNNYTDSGYKAFFWTQEQGMVGLGAIPDGGSENWAYGVSVYGSVVVGKYDSTAFIWDSTHGIQNLKEVLTNNYGLDLTGWNLHSANSISADGLTIVGSGSHDGRNEAWIADLRPSSEIATSNDDAESFNCGSVNYGSTVMRVGFQNWAPWIGGVRFTGLPIPQGANIAMARLSLAPWISGSINLHSIIYGIAENSTLPFDRSEPFCDRPRTNAGATWTVNGTVTAGTYIGGSEEDFPSDVTAIVQELVNRVDWIEGNPIGFVLTSEPPYQGTYATFSTFESGSPARLYVTWTAEPTGQPTISYTPTSLSPSCEFGSNAPNQQFEVWNAGTGTLNYSLSDNADWLSCNPESGTSTGEHDTIEINYTTSGLDPGEYNATITITSPDADNSPQTIPVTLTVNERPSRIIGSVTTPGNAGGVCVVGAIAFVADGTEGLQVIDVNDPEYPEIIGWIETPGPAEGVYVVGDLAYVTTGDDLVIIDVSDFLGP